MAGKISITVAACGLCLALISSSLVAQPPGRFGKGAPGPVVPGADPTQPQSPSAKQGMKGKAAMKGGRFGGANTATTNPLFAALDSNQDGLLSAAELANAAQSLAKLDANQDGNLTAQELGLEHDGAPTMSSVGRGGRASGGRQTPPAAPAATPSPASTTPSKSPFEE